jgi:hypothetical protein
MLFGMFYEFGAENPPGPPYCFQMTANSFLVPLWKSMTTAQIPTICLTACYMPANIQCSETIKSTAVSQFRSGSSARPGLGLLRCGRGRS